MSDTRDRYAQVGAAMRAAIDAALEADDLTFGEAKVLLAVVREVGTYSRLSDRVSRARLAEVARVSERTVSSALGRLSGDLGALTYTASRGRGKLSTVGLRPAETGSPGLRVFDVEEVGKREAESAKTGSPGLRAPEEVSEETPPAPAKPTHRQPPIVAGVKGEGLETGGPRAELRDVTDVQTVDELLERLPDRVARRIDRRQRTRLARDVATARDAGWTPAALAAAVLELDRELGSLDDLDDLARTAGAIGSRIRRLGAPPPARTAAAAPCEPCAGTGMALTDDGAVPCPSCRPGVVLDTAPRIDRAPTVAAELLEEASA